MTDEFEERKQVFTGKIRKCPNCGVQITTDTAKCPSCGFVIEKESVSTAMEEFAKKFVSLSSELEKKDFVETYPIPNNKDDIRGFLNYATNQRDKDYATDKIKVFWITVWNNKCRLIVNQAYDVFCADTEFVQYLRNYKKEVEESSIQINKLKKKLLLGKIAKISVVAVLVLAVAGVFVIKEKKRAELIAGCVVPKENVVINKIGDLEVLTDAIIKTANITQRIDTESKEPVWCLDTIVNVDVKPRKDILSEILKKREIVFPEYYKSSDFKGELFIRTINHEEVIDCSYQSQSVVKHGFDNVHQISEKILNFGGKDLDKPYSLEIKLTQIAGSKRECENLAMKLHKNRKFSFEIVASYDQFHDNWVKNNKNK